MHEGSEAAGPHVHGITDRLDSKFLYSHTIALSEGGAPIVANLRRKYCGLPAIGGKFGICYLRDVSEGRHR